MALKGAVLGIPVVMKQSGGRFFPSGYNKQGGKEEYKLAFTAASKACAGVSGSRPNVFAESARNKCIASKLRIASKLSK